MAGLFITYEKVSDGFARITQSMQVIDHEPYAKQLTEQGLQFYFIPLDGFSGYFELDENGHVLAIDTRPEFARKFDKTTVGIFEPTTVSDVPACQVEVHGGLISKVVEHPGGDLSLQFGLSGSYQVSFECFPALRYSEIITVESRAPNPAPVAETGQAPAPAPQAR